MGKKHFTEKQIAFALRQQEAGSRIRYRYRRLHVLLRREGWMVNHKLVYRLYVEESLILRRKGPKRRKSTVVRQEPSVAQVRNDSWSMDFMSDQLFKARRFRVLT